MRKSRETRKIQATRVRLELRRSSQACLCLLVSNHQKFFDLILSISPNASSRHRKHFTSSSLALAGTDFCSFVHTRMVFLLTHSLATLAGRPFFNLCKIEQFQPATANRILPITARQGGETCNQGWGLRYSRPLAVSSFPDPKTGILLLAHVRTGDSEGMLNLEVFSRRTTMPPSCPICRSKDVRRSKRRGMLESTILNLIPLRPFRCMDCDYRFYGLASSATS